MCSIVIEELYAELNRYRNWWGSNSTL